MTLALGYDGAGPHANRRPSAVTGRTNASARLDVAAGVGSRIMSTSGATLMLLELIKDYVFAVEPIPCRDTTVPALTTAASR
jgi:hypothetical protein